MKVHELKSIGRYGPSPANHDDLKVSKAVKAISRVRFGLVGAGSVFDLAGSKVAVVGLGSIGSDFLNIAADFNVVGNDFREAIRADFKAISAK